jgi:ubiquinone/menaquinone biosynthesis C-methylase UbiE
MIGGLVSSPAETYETYLVPTFFAHLTTRVLEVAQPQPGDRVLDAACGTGVVARRVASILGARGRVVGLDLNPAMLAVARSAAAREGLDIDWREGRIEALPFPDGDFDLGVCQHGLQFVPDRAAAVAEMRRVLRDGGRVVVSVSQSLERHPLDHRLNDVLQARLGVAAISQIYALGDADELRALLAGAGLRDIEVVPVTFEVCNPDPERFLTMRLTSVTAGVPSLQHLDERGREEMIAAVGEEMEETLREYTMGDEVVRPVHVHIARATR